RRRGCRRPRPTATAPAAAPRGSRRRRPGGGGRTPRPPAPRRHGARRGSRRGRRPSPPPSPRAARDRAGRCRAAGSSCLQSTENGLLSGPQLWLRGAAGAVRAATRGSGRRARRYAIAAPLDTAGFLGAAATAWISTSPSLLPRTWWMWAVNIGLSEEYGYASGAIAG